MSDQERFEDEFENQFEQAFEPEAEPDAPSEELPDQSLPPEPEASQTFEFQGRTFTHEQLEPVAKFAAWANENPERWEKLQRWESGEIDFSTPQVIEQAIPQPPEPEEEFDPYDETYLRDLGRKQRELEEHFTRQREAEGRAAVDAGITAFSAAHQDLSHADMNSVLKKVHEWGALASIPPDLPYAAKQKAISDLFEEGYKVLFYDRIRADETRQVVSDMDRRRRASASSSSSVSSPRVKPAPSTPEEKRQAYIDDIAQALAEGN